MQSIETPSLLVALPSLRDPNFFHSVVLLLECNDQGALGFILNKPAPHQVKDLLIDGNIEMVDHLPAWYGGPVDTERGLVLHNQGDESERSPFGHGIFLSSSEGSVQAMIRFARQDADDLAAYSCLYPYRFIIGYAGWGPRQLTEEVLAGAWVHLPFSQELAFSTPWRKMWTECLRSLGVDPKELIPSANPFLN